MTPFVPEGGPRGARAGAGSPRRFALAPGVLKLALGLLICLPGGLIVLLGVGLLAPGLVLVSSGANRLTEYLLAASRPERPKVGSVDRDSPMAWTAPSSRMLQ